MRIAFVRPTLVTAAIVASAGILAGGFALRPAFAVVGSATVNPATTCSKTTPCKSFKNSGTGAGLQGINANAATSGVGLLGTATSNGIGVQGQGSTGSGVYGTSASGIGVDGASSSSDGVLGLTSSSNPAAAGVQGDNNATTVAVRANGFGGPLFVGNSLSNVDVFTVADDGSTTIGGAATVTGLSGLYALIAGSSASLGGVVGQGLIGVSGFALGASPYGVVGYNLASSGGAALAAQDVSGTGDLIEAYDNGGNLMLQVQDDGTVYAHNFVIAFDTPTHQKVTTYATMSSAPNIEDFGEAQLIGGQAYVNLKRTFAAEIDSRLAYMVFITPEGDTRGLYVTQKTHAGFVVRENQGGRSDAAFSYRIVAKPYGSTTATPRRGIAPPHRLPTLPKLHRVPKIRP